MAASDQRSLPAVPARDRQVLRELGKRMADLSALAIQEERRGLWAKVNQLESARPVVWVFEVPWIEMDVDGELEPVCTSPLCRGVEVNLRRRLYQWDHMQGDMVIEPGFAVPPAVRDTGFGISEDVDIVRTDPRGGVVSRHYHIQIADESDAAKIKMPEVTLDEAAWDRNTAFFSELFDGVLPVHRGGMKGTSIAPWDLLIRLTGVEEALMDMVARPGYIHAVMDRLTTAHLRRLDRYEELGILALNNDDTHLGGGYQYMAGLPAPNFEPSRVRPCDMWGRTMSQIFSTVSPAMHEEFALQYECRYLNRFGVTYYGCCEPLDKKVDILRKNVPNLRKISMSPWIDLDVAAENVGTDFAFSWKANPAVLAGDSWDPEFVRRDMRATLERLRGMHVEIIMKDISTVRYEPQRLWEWAAIASEVAEEFAS